MFNAVQVVNRFQEVFASPSTRKRRLDELEEVFADTVAIRSLKTDKVLLSGKANVRASFAGTLSHECSSSRRIFIESPEAEEKNAEVNGSVNNSKSRVSFCFDLHQPGSSPGLGDPSKNTVLLYRCQDSLITAVWGCVDKQSLASEIAGKLTKSDILQSELWPLVLRTVRIDWPDAPEDCNGHFSDYTNIETWG